MATALVWDERLMWHDAGNQFGPRSPWIEPGPPPETPETKRRIKNLLDASGLTARLTVLAPRPATRAELERVHTPAYLDRIEATSRAGGGNIASRAHTHIGGNGFEIASLAAGATITAVEAVMAGTVRNAYALLRPPGHHAEAAAGQGFCVFNNGAVAAAHALDALGLARVAIVDLDAHHGNGAQSIFWRDPRVLTLSVHQERAFPLSVGDTSEQGEGPGLGFAQNIPLPAGSSEAAYRAAMDRVIVPALALFRPDLVIVACGLDAGFMDPTARMLLSSDSFRHLTQSLMQAADRLCEGRIVFTHEGGYHIQTVPFHALAVFETLSGLRTGVEDPFLPAVAQSCAEPLLPHHEAAIARAENALRAAPPIPRTGP